MSIENDILKITLNYKTINIQISKLIFEKETIYSSNINMPNEILFFEEHQEYNILVYLLNGNLIVLKTKLRKNEVLKKYITLKTKALFVKLTKKNLYIFSIVAILNPNNFKIKKLELRIGKNDLTEIKPSVFSKLKSKFKLIKALKFIKVKLDDINCNNHINNVVGLKITLDNNITIKSAMSMKNRWYEKKNKMYYIPITCRYLKDHAVHIRRSYKGSLVFVHRRKNDIERSAYFRILNSAFVSFILYFIGKVIMLFCRKPINIYYEKYAAKAEEGTYDLFLMALPLKTSKNYYIIEENSVDYSRIGNVKNVIKKYSPISYFLIYSASNFISTEVPMHLNVLQSNNKFFRRAMMNKSFIFLQHGITYLKNHDKNSTYCKNKEGEPDYIVTSSKKEMDAIRNVLELEYNKMINVGLPIFDKIKHNSINEKSANKVIIMLTWKPYDENLMAYEESDCYRNSFEIIELLKKYIPLDEIILIPHPKVANRVMHTDLKKYTINKPINEQLKEGKLLITDYSSVCYNTFYQGGGVIFYQSDLEKYESNNGSLIPKNNEYIGYRVFNKDDLEELIEMGIKDGIINLPFFRKDEFIKNYSLINEFNDGKNIERLAKELKKLKII